jgi:uncharacterized protein YndB with AHSA1/START domain
MRPVTLRCTIDAPRERVFDYLLDLANFPEFTDHFLAEFRLERMDSKGVGAAARFRVRSHPPVWAEAVIVQADPPHRIVLEGRQGRLARVPTRTEFRLTGTDHGMTRLELSFSSDPAAPGDRLREALGARPWLRRQWRKALGRLKQVLEEGEPSEHAVRVAAG